MHHAMSDRGGKLADLIAQERDDLVERRRHVVHSGERHSSID